MSTIFELASKMDEALKNKAHLLEGDQLDDDQDENKDDPNAVNPDTGGDVGGDIGGGDIGSGGDGAGSNGEGPDTDTEEEIDQMQNNVEAEQNVPKDLVLNDGTTTNTSVDSSTQVEPLNQDKKDFLFQFGEGNFDEFSQSAKEYSQSVTSVIHTFVPLCEKALIELFGNSSFYKREMFDAKTSVNGDTTSIDVNLRYKANAWIGNDIPYAAIQSDKQHIINTISVVPGITVKQVNIDSNTGNLDISVNIGGVKEQQENPANPANPANAQMQQQVVNENKESEYERITENIENWISAESSIFEENWDGIAQFLRESGVTDEDDALLLKGCIWKSHITELQDGDEIAFLSKVQENLEKCNCTDAEKTAEEVYNKLNN